MVPPLQGSLGRCEDFFAFTELDPGAVHGVVRRRRTGCRSDCPVGRILMAVYVEVVAKAVELRRQGKTHAEVCEELNRLGYRTRMGKLLRHPQQVVKLPRSFGGEGLRFVQQPRLRGCVSAGS